MPTPASRPLRTFWLVGLVTLILYIALFWLIEQRRHRNGPWVLTFTQIDATLALVIDHPKLQLTNVTILFAEGATTTTLPQTISFRQGQVAPLDLPFGKCIFLDTLFLPGTVTCEIFGNEIQILPRTMTINRREHPWRSNEKILLTNRPSATLPAN
jgi:hypothetical protein